MSIYNFKRRKHRGGFTLVEIIVVLVVLAILAALLVPSMVKWIKKAEERKLVVPTRACVTAAQTLATEEYGRLKAAGKEATPFRYVPSDEDIRALADIKEGEVTSVVLDLDSATVNSLVYKDADGNRCTYVRGAGSLSDDSVTLAIKESLATPHYVFGDGPQWELGQTYAVGDIMSSNGYIFQCIRANTTGTTSRTRDPSLRSNKSTWEVIGYTGDPLRYSSTVRYGVGTPVEYYANENGTLVSKGFYVRTDFNLVGGQVPYAGRDSDYWLYIGPTLTTP